MDDCNATEGGGKGKAGLSFVSFFAGIGGIDLGLERAGHVCVGQVEIDPFCQKVLAKHWPETWRHDDITTVRPEDIPAADLWCGGFPCQDISNAGKRAGIHGERSGLFFDFMRLVRAVRPRYLLLENVAALLSNGMGSVLGELAESGYDAEWSVLSACAMGAPHTRARVFIVAYPAEHRCEGNVCEVGQQTVHDLPPETLDAWHGSGSPFEHFEKLLAESGAVRVADGFSSTVDIRPRLHAYGNAVVPQVAEYIGNLLMEATQ